MKVKTIIQGVIFGMLALSSCKKDDDTTLVKDPVAPVITNPSGAKEYNLIPANENGTFETYIWKAAEFGSNVDASYTVQIDKASGDFSAPVNVKESTTELWQSVSTSEMNLKLQELGVSPEQSTMVQVRVMALGGDITLYSNPISFQVNRYIYDNEVPVWNIFGTATGIEDNTLMTHDEGNDTWSVRMDLVDGVIKFKDSSIQATILGMDAEGTLVKDGSDINITAGNYSVSLDANALTYTLTKNELPSNLYFVGSVNGWSADAPLTTGAKDEANGMHWGFLDVAVDSEIKILTAIGSWDGYGAGASAGLITEGGGNIVLKDQPGYNGPAQYIVKLDVKLGTIELVEITSVAIVGDGANAGWPEDHPGVELVFDSSTKAYNGDVTYNVAGEWKIRINQTWDYNLGGTASAMTFDGDNFATPGATTKALSVNLITASNFNYLFN